MWCMCGVGASRADKSLLNAQLDAVSYPCLGLGQSTCQSTDQLVNVFARQTVQPLLCMDPPSGHGTHARASFASSELVFNPFGFLFRRFPHASMTLHLLSGATSTLTSLPHQLPARYCKSFTQQLTMQYADLTGSDFCFMPHHVEASDLFFQSVVTSAAKEGICISNESR